MSGQDGGGAPPAGWYDDPEVAGGLRWWDGQTWTEHRRAAPSAPPGSDPWRSDPAGPSSRPAETWPPGGGQAVGTVDTWLWQSILATIFCCQPLGIVAIVFAAQAQSAVSAGDLPTARAKAASARTWTLVAVGIGFAVLSLLLLFGFFGALAGR